MPSGDSGMGEIFLRRLVGFTLETRRLTVEGTLGDKECEEATEEGCCVPESGDSGSGGSGESGPVSCDEAPAPSTLCSTAPILDVGVVYCLTLPLGSRLYRYTLDPETTYNIRMFFDEPENDENNNIVILTGASCDEQAVVSTVGHGLPTSELCVEFGGDGSVHAMINLFGGNGTVSKWIVEEGPCP